MAAVFIGCDIDMKHEDETSICDVDADKKLSVEEVHILKKLAQATIIMKWIVASLTAILLLVSSAFSAYEHLLAVKK